MKVTTQVYTKVKKLLKSGMTGKTVAKVSGLCAETVGFIKNTKNITEYKAFMKKRGKTIKKKLSLEKRVQRLEEKVFLEKKRFIFWK